MEERNVILVTSSNQEEAQIKDILKELNVSVDVAESPQMALECFKEKNFFLAVIVADDKEINPYALIHSINLMQFDVLCVIIQEDVNADSLSLAYDLGTYDIIDKNNIYNLVEIVKSI